MVRLIVPLLFLVTLTALVKVLKRRSGKAGEPSWLPKTTADALMQLSLFVFADLLYETVRGVAENDPAAAFEHARTLVAIEQSTGLFFEQGLQAWAMGHRFLIDVTNFIYVNSQFVVTTSVLVWLYLRHNDRFYFVRNMFMFSMGLALIGYLLFPTAPPRFFSELGFIDTIAYYVDVQHDSGLVTLFFNPYAAVPSMHVAFSLMVGIPAAMVVRRRWAKVLWCCYPLLITFVVVVTGNHWIVDAMLGALVAGLAAFGARALSRAWPEAWSWSPRTAEATA
ncbi:MAG: phosphatase PAP2 family protein [Solirubrobacterales bacterium]